MEVLSVATLAAITTGLVEVLKRTRGVSRFIEGRYELVAIVVSLIIGLAGGLDWLSSLLAALSSMGLYNIADRGVEELKTRIK